MGRLKATIGAACVAGLFTATAAGAQGIVPDRTTFVTISAPVSLPGVVLPAGTYMLRLADTLASRNVVQIYDRDRTKIFATLITVSAERNEPSGDAVITFRESPADQPPALRYWYYAGEKGGHEFVYPKDQAMQIAQRSGESVLAVDTSSSDLEDMKTGEISRVEGATAAQAAPERPRQGSPTAAEPREPAATESTAASRTAEAPVSEPAAGEPAAAPAAAAESAAAQSRTDATIARDRTRDAEPGATGTTGSAAAPQTPAAGDAGRNARRELPRTGSEMPLVGLLGLLALGAGLGVRVLRQRVLV
jgi:LPXTG-motif cell wall-anchored protein